jgi:hypothetical protein
LRRKINCEKLFIPKHWRHTALREKQQWIETHDSAACGHDELANSIGIDFEVRRHRLNTAIGTQTSFPKMLKIFGHRPGRRARSARPGGDI